MEGLMFTVAITAAACVLIGIARLVAWVIDRREEDKTRVIRDAAFVAQARAELRRKEIEASKRGDLRSAASYAELADRDYAVSMLDQQDMGEGRS